MFASGDVMVLEFIKDFEGFRPRAYTATPNEKQRNIWTIGYGFTNINGISVKENDTITETEASKLLQKEIEHLIKTHNLENYPINQKTALTSLIFNIGSGAYNKSTLKKRLDNSKSIELDKRTSTYNKVIEYFSVCNLPIPSELTEFHRWCLQSGKVLKGLLIRRDKESKLFMSV